MQPSQARRARRRGGHVLRSPQFHRLPPHRTRPVLLEAGERRAYMTRVGVTGHQRLTPRTRDLIAEGLAAQLSGIRELRGITSLAEGTDQIFAQEVVSAGGRLT